MCRIAIALLLAGSVAAPERARSPAPAAPTDEQLTLAGIEVRRLVTLLGLEPGMTVADVGAGLGAWMFRVSQWTGPSGHLYATDLGEAQLTAWAPEGRPAWVPPEIGGSYVMIFEKAR